MSELDLLISFYKFIVCIFGLWFTLQSYNITYHFFLTSVTLDSSIRKLRVKLYLPLNQNHSGPTKYQFFSKCNTVASTVLLCNGGALIITKLYDSGAFFGRLCHGGGHQSISWRWPCSKVSDLCRSLLCSSILVTRAARLCN
jgi:hypothetical protein